MKKPIRRRHFLREWREARDFSLRDLQKKMHGISVGEAISYASLSRIETGKQPYNELILNAISDALNVEPWMLLIVDPEKNLKIVDMINLLPEEKKPHAFKLIEF